MLDDTIIGTQKRGRRAAMTAAELDVFLVEQRVARLASLTSSGAPHASALWFVWDGAAMWFYSIVKSQRWVDVLGDPRVSVVVDGGHDFGELHGVELRGRLEQVGEVPRTGETEDAELVVPERLFAEKYVGSPDGEMFHDTRHAWLVLRPQKIASWDFRKVM
jgi:Pyridoxamine 5'-phosphate oxidase